ncbi:MAG: ATP-binding cassette domain-containing protein, partial [Oscillospiraceae bacterium]|nr:ATP-binding cassette domain-containing protein [Oscillospiraceae bacterium]
MKSRSCVKTQTVSLSDVFILRRRREEVPNTRKLLSITDLKKYFPVAKSSLFQKESLYVRANEEITLDIYEGETVGIVGESGCGKSTLGRVLLQLYEQTAGSAMYYGRTLSEVAPYYIEHTLKNASKYLTKYKNAQALADKLTAECDALGDSATFYKLQEKNLAVANARSALMNIVKIMGGFIVTDELEQSAKVLLKEHHINVAIAKYNHKIADLAAEIELLHTQKDDLAEEGKDTASIEKKITAFQAKIERIADSIEALEAKKPAIKEELNALKAKHADNAEFANMYHEGSRSVGAPNMEEYNAQVYQGIRLDTNHYLRIFPVSYQFRGFFAPILSKAICALDISELLGDQELREEGIRQTEWILGFNPFTVSGEYGE